MMGRCDGVSGKNVIYTLRLELSVSLNTLLEKLCRVADMKRRRTTHEDRSGTSNI